MFASLPPLDDAVRAAYLARLGVESGPPSVESMYTLARRHAERVPYETMWIQSGELWGIDPAESARRTALEGRGGYCYHLNGALGLLLHSLGYHVQGHIGGVHLSAGPEPDAAGNHLVLTVAALPTDSNPAGAPGTSTPAWETPSTNRSHSLPGCTCRVRSRWDWNASDAASGT